MKLIFTRHGESQANIEGILSNRDLPHDLSEKGRWQAQHLSEQLLDMNVTAIYASPILRAQQTAEIVAGRLGLSFSVADALREFDCGVMEGRGDAAAWQAHHDVIKAWTNGQHDVRIEGGESFQDLKNRFQPFIADIVRQFENSQASILLISHGSVLQQMLPLVLHNVTRRYSQQHPLANCALVIAAPSVQGLAALSWNDQTVAGS
jgi:broad specificity phosphatase PhoE